MPITSSAKTVKEKIDGIWYIIDINYHYAKVTYDDDKQYTGNIVIPSTIDYEGTTYNITEIGPSAFSGCSELLTVSIPTSVSYIGKWAFSNCIGLMSVEMQNGVTNIGDYAFNGCSNLPCIVLPNSVTHIGNNSFQDCSNLASITIGNNVKTIKSAFGGCTSLSSVHILDLEAWCKIDFSGSSANPLYYAHHLYLNDEEIKELDIPISITSIKPYAFTGCTELLSVLLPNSITHIGKYAFDDCGNLISINLPNDITSIGDNAFANCNSLSSISFPNSITSIGYDAFKDCFNLKSLFIPKNVKTIIGAFPGCIGLTSIVVDADNITFDSRDNCNAIIETATNKLIIGCNNTIIPPSVTSFSSGAFQNSISVSLPEGIETINTLMFESCNYLESISIPKSVKSIEEPAFENCPKLNRLTFEDGDSTLVFELPYYHISLGYYPKWFINCPLDSIYIGRNMKFEFYDKDYKRYYNASPFKDNHSIHEVIFSDKVSIIPHEMFIGCTNLERVVIGNSMVEIGDKAFENCHGLKAVEMSDNITTIGRSAFSGCSSLESFKIPSNLTSIEASTFAYCEKIPSITIPSKVQKIDGFAFYGCTALSSVIIEDGNELLELEYSSSFGLPIFDNCPITYIYTGRDLFMSNNNPPFQKVTTPFSLTIGKNVNQLSGSIFANCMKISQLSIENGDDLLSCTSSLFSGTAVDSIYLGRKVSDSSLFSWITTPFSLRIGNSITEIDDRSLSSCKIASLYIPNSVMKIGASSFYGCNNMSSVVLEDGCEVLAFTDGNEFNFCALEKLYIGRDITYPVNKSPFVTNKERLTNVEFGKTVTIISDSEFTGCKSIQALNFPNSLTKIGAYAFYGCDALTELNIPSSVSEIGYNAFKLCRGLTSVTLEDGLDLLTFTTSETSAFSLDFLDSPLEKVYLGRNINYASNSSPFHLSSTLTHVTIGANVTNLGSKLFSGCPALKDVVSYPQSIPSTGNYVFTEDYLCNATLHVPAASFRLYKESYPWNKFNKIVSIEGIPLPYFLTYIVDGEVFKTYEYNEGDTIIPEEYPTKEGYTFSGWSEIPETMPAHDLIVTGSFIINSYTLTYIVDGKEYKKIQYEYGAVIMPEASPEKEGYTFSGWSEIPATMPAHDMTVTGTFSVNSYSLTYIVDGEEYKKMQYEYGATITPEAEPEKEGFTFSGWNNLPTTMPAHDVMVTGTFNVNNYQLTYIIDGKEYKILKVAYGTIITPEAEPIKEGYTFSGWTGLPETMPAHDVTVTGSFTVNSYKLTYMVDGQEYKSYSVEYGAAITPESGPEKEGHTFSGWTDLPETMPAHDVTVTGTYTVNSYTLTYVVDGQEYKSYSIEYGTAITPEAEPEKEGYTFSGWSEIPETMPAKDVTVTGTFSINSYTLTYMIGEVVYKQVVYEYGEVITPEPAPEGDYKTFEWVGVPETMPAHDVTVTAVYETGIYTLLMMAQQGLVRIYTPNGKLIDRPQHGLNIVVTVGGTVRKVVVR